jgi:hypothetical protein
MDADISRATFAGWSCPGVIQSNATKSVFIFQYVSAYAISMWKRGAWIRSYTAKNSNRITKPITEAIQMMDGHDTQRYPAKVCLPGHPMWNASHVDIGDDWGAYLIGIQ